MGYKLKVGDSVHWSMYNITGTVMHVHHRATGYPYGVKFGISKFDGYLHDCHWFNHALCSHLDKKNEFPLRISIKNKLKKILSI